MCKNVELAKKTFFRHVSSHENLQFFRLSVNSFKMMKNTTTWPLDTWNVNIYPFGWEICKCVKLAKMTLFRQVCGHENLHFFWLSGKPFKLMKNTTTWPQDTWNVNIYPFEWEICKNVKLEKNDTFSTGPRTWKSSIFFNFLESLLNWWKTPPHDHRTLKMWIFTHLGEKYAKR